MDNLNDLLLREQGFEPCVDFGFVAALGVSIRAPKGGIEQYTKLTARRVEYVRGTLYDPDVEVVPVVLFQELKSVPLSRNTEDIADAVKRAYLKISHTEGCVGVPIPIDFGPGEGALTVNELRQNRTTASSLFPLRTVADRDHVTPMVEAGRGTWTLSAEALIGGLVARATSGQILIDKSSDDDTRLAFIQAMREAGQAESSIEAGLTRIMAWTSEILLRPLVQPCFQISSYPRRPVVVSNDRMRMR
jgi:hypothetical protein